MNYLTGVADELGISVLMLAIIYVWSAVWKLLGLWKSARKKQVGWFVVIALLNTLGILPILYYFLFSEMKSEKKKSSKKRKSK